MNQVLTRYPFQITIAFFLIINIIVYCWMILGHNLIPFARTEYLSNAHHYKVDPRFQNGDFDFLNALGQYDGQWYLKIAERGYPDRPQEFVDKATKPMHGMSYNFFPLYPLLITGVNLLISNIELSAFLLTLVIQISILLSCYFVVSHWYTRVIALKTTILLTVYPFSIFVRGYYNEGLRLLLFIWLCYWMLKKNYFLSAVMISLLCLASGVSWLLPPFFLIFLFMIYRRKKISFFNVLLYTAISGSGVLIWILYCYLNTGSPVYFLTAMSSWVHSYEIPFLQNIALFVTTPWLPMRGFHGSQLDELIILLTLLAAIYSRKLLPKTLWFMTGVLAITPLVVQDSVSFARFSLVLFPYYVFAAKQLQTRYYILLILFFFLMLLIVSLGFINWYWVE